MSPNAVLIKFLMVFLNIVPSKINRTGDCFSRTTNRYGMVKSAMSSDQFALFHCTLFLFLLATCYWNRAMYPPLHGVKLQVQPL